jgi:hypothetical protein
MVWRDAGVRAHHAPVDAVRFEDFEPRSGEPGRREVAEADRKVRLANAEIRQGSRAQRPAVRAGRVDAEVVGAELAVPSWCSAMT